MKYRTNIAWNSDFLFTYFSLILGVKWNISRLCLSAFVFHWTYFHWIAVCSGKSTCSASLELGLNEVSHLVSPFRSELLCFFENSFFFFQILFFTTLKKKRKKVPAGACDLAEIYQINVSYALLSLEVNQEVTLIHLTTRWIFKERPIKWFFCNVCLKSLSMGCSVLYGTFKSTCLTRYKEVM